jgi:hypothetical protein
MKKSFMNPIGKERKKRPLSAHTEKKTTVEFSQTKNAFQQKKDDHYLKEIREQKRKQNELEFRNQLLCEENDELRRKVNEIRTRLDDINMKSEESKLREENVFLKETLEKKDRKINELRRRSATTTILELVLGRDEAINEVMRLRNILKEERNKFELNHIHSLKIYNNNNLVGYESSPPLYNNNNNNKDDDDETPHRINDHPSSPSSVDIIKDSSNKKQQQSSPSSVDHKRCLEESELIIELRDQLKWLRHKLLDSEQLLSLKNIELSQLKLKIVNNKISHKEMQNMVKKDDVEEEDDDDQRVLVMERRSSKPSPNTIEKMIENKKKSYQNSKDRTQSLNENHRKVNKKTKSKTSNNKQHNKDKTNEKRASSSNYLDTRRTDTWELVNHGVETMPSSERMTESPMRESQFFDGRYILNQGGSDSSEVPSVQTKLSELGMMMSKESK